MVSVVPPDAVTPWERFQIERLGRWLATHELDEALDLLRRRCPAVPPVVEDTLRQWARGATRIVLTTGIVVEG